MYICAKFALSQLVLSKLVDEPNNGCEARGCVPEMNKFLQLTVVKYQVCYELLYGDNRKSQLVISQVTQITKQGLDAVQTQHLEKTETAQNITVK